MNSQMGRFGISIEGTKRPKPWVSSLHLNLFLLARCASKNQPNDNV